MNAVPAPRGEIKIEAGWIWRRFWRTQEKRISHDSTHLGTTTVCEWLYMTYNKNWDGKTKDDLNICWDGKGTCPDSNKCEFPNLLGGKWDTYGFQEKWLSKSVKVEVGHVRLCKTVDFYVRFGGNGVISGCQNWWNSTSISEEIEYVRMSETVDTKTVIMEMGHVQMLQTVNCQICGGRGGQCPDGIICEFPHLCGWKHIAGSRLNPEKSRKKGFWTRLTVRMDSETWTLTIEDSSFNLRFDEHFEFHLLGLQVTTPSCSWVPDFRVRAQLQQGVRLNVFSDIRDG